MQTLTEEEVRVMYQDRQKEPFPQRRNVMGILLATIFLLGTIGVWGLLLWVIASIV